MSYEVDVMAVGEESKSGDALVFRYGDFSYREGFRVVAIDGGFQASGEKLVEHVRTFYHTNDVDLHILTHPDADHVNGAAEVLEQMNVRRLWMHTPWTHVAAGRAYFEQRVRRSITSQKMRNALEGADELEKLAERKGVPVEEPFAGTSFDNRLFVLGPTRDYYQSLIPAFLGETTHGPTPFSNLIGRVYGAAQRAANWLTESWFDEKLVEPVADATSPQNNSSVVLVAKLDERWFLFTGDAGVPALARAADFADAAGFSLPDNLAYFQAPHHGSKRNVGPAILDRILGPVVSEGQVNGKTAVISAAEGGEPKHPSKRVTNALRRRGARVIATQGTGFCLWSAPRPGWTGSVAEVPFATSYDDGD